MTTQQTFDFWDSSSASAWDQPVKLGAAPGGPPRPASNLSACSPPTDRQTVLRDLRRQAGCINTVPQSDDSQPVLSTGSIAIDGLLPRGGLRTDAMTEWVSDADGCGAMALSMITAAMHLQAVPGPLVVVSGKSFYPPAAVALGVPAERIILIQPTQHADVVWAVDQALRCRSVAAVWAHLGANLDDRDARRFQLAAEAGCTPGLFIRPAAVRHFPSFAEVRFHVGNQTHPKTQSPADHSSLRRGRQMKVTLDRCRGGTVDQSVWIQIDDQAHILPVTPHSYRSNHATAAMRLASELAHPATPNQPARRRA